MSNPDNLSLLGNTDGVALIRSSRAGVWPIYYVINELPPRERFSRANRLFAGLWFGKGKPHFATFMKPFCQSIRDLYTEGIEIATKAASSKRIRGILLDTTMDAPARSAWLNIRQFNGYSGCQVCTEPGEQLDLGPGKKNTRRQCHVYPFNAEYAQTTGHAKLREHTVVRQQALVAMSQISQKGKVVNPQEGVLGLSWAFSLPLHDVIAGTAVDYMHCICEGAVNQHLMAWFEDKSNDCYLGNSINEIDSTLLSFKPISEITRRPRSISDWKQWKANEKRAFLLYYSIPLLTERLNETCLLHLSFLVGGVYRLLKDSISKIDLEEAGVFLKLYCAQAPYFYGKRFQTFNLHQLLHLKNNVENLGSLWSNSCFPFEDYNGDLKGYFHGSQNIQGQIVNSICVHQSLPQLAETIPESDAKQLSRELLSKSYHCRTVGEEIGHDTFVVGSLERVWETSSLLSENEREVVGAVSKMWVFKRAIVIGVEYQSFLYKRTTSRNNCTVIFQRHGKNHYGSIEKFVKCLEKCSRMQCLHEKCSCSLSVRYIALVRKLSRHPCQFPVYHGMQVVKHILRVTITDRVLAVPISYIKEKCMRIDVDPTRVYVCHTPNSFEKD